MRIIHIADLHLGYRAYHRITREGVNQREQDVQDSFNDALRKIAPLKPDLLLMAGDLFHSVRPSNLVLQRTFTALRKFREHCMAPLVMIAGNHESPRAADTGCILRLFANLPNVIVRDSKYDAIRLPDPKATVFCLPHRGLGELDSLLIKPETDSETNLLMLHGTLEGIADSDYGGVEIKRSQVLGDKWDYIALGHYHIKTKIAENAYYSGSVEYTSNNPWEEIGKGQPKKGFIEYDTEAREMTFHEVKAREFVDMPAIKGNGLSASEIMNQIEEATAKIKGGIAEKVVRLVIWDVPRKVQIDLDHARLREIRAGALHYDLSLRIPKVKGSAALSSSGAIVRRSLEQEWTEYADEAELPGGVERDPFRQMGIDYLARASAESVPSDGVEDAKSA